MKASLVMIVTPSGEVVMFLVEFVHWLVCLFVCEQDYMESFE